MPHVSDAAMLRSLMDEQGVSQADVVRGTGISKTVHLLSSTRKRDLTREHIKALSKYLGVNPTAFLGTAPPVRVADHATGRELEAATTRFRARAVQESPSNHRSLTDANRSRSGRSRTAKTRRPGSSTPPGSPPRAQLATIVSPRCLSASPFRIGSTRTRMSANVRRPDGCNPGRPRSSAPWTRHRSPSPPRETPLRGPIVLVQGLDDDRLQPEGSSDRCRRILRPSHRRTKRSRTRVHQRSAEQVGLLGSPIAQADVGLAP